MDKIVYTSIDGFRLKKWEVRSYKELNDEFVSWIEETTIKLIQKRSPAELKALCALKTSFSTVYAQPFFLLHGHSYFLDAYLPELKLAVEIDGKYHKDRKVEDRQRDLFFREIGIRTIRIMAKEVGDNFLEVLASKVNKVKKAKKPKNRYKATKEPRIIRSAWKRLKEHEANKHRAKWV